MKALHLGQPGDLEKLLPLVAGFHAEQGIDSDDAHRRAAIVPLLEGVPQGAVWLIGPRRAPVGYVAVSFGWSIEFGGLDAMVDEIYIRPAVRGRGMGYEALNGLAKALKDAGVRALHLEADRSDERLLRFYLRARFQPREDYALLSRLL